MFIPPFVTHLDCSRTVSVVSPTHWLVCDLLFLGPGEIIGIGLADVREAQYELQGLQDYMFRLDRTRVIDATVQGSLARFINHCCDVRVRSVLDLLSAWGVAGIRG